MAAAVLQLAELGLHGAAFLCGVVCAAALTVAQGEFGGRCPLYGAVSWNGTALVPEAFSHPSLCSFVSGVSVVAALCGFAALLRGVAGCCGQEAPRDRPWLGIALAVAFIVLFFLLVSACILRVGMDAFCASIVQAKGLASCQEAEQQPWGSYSPARFYSNLYSAQASGWVSAFLWALLSARLLARRRSGTPAPESSAESEAILGGRR
ncbi:transmembrane protein 179B isoform X2 [Opisthocomus hoazin]|uniref:transmembrane protein 179B isoform X2 n=1 Tax=Opisthocomus hoazin TaxID=30419 RepID=UPI003F534B84